MNKKAIKIIAVLFLGFITIAANARSNTLYPNVSEESVDSYCAASSSSPYRSGSTVYGTGGLYCTQTVGQIRVVVQVRDRNSLNGPIIRQTTPAKEKICYNTSSCSITADLSYIGGRYYDTATSGYFGLQSSYDQSNQVYIP